MSNFKSTSYDYLIKLLLIGDSGAGKSCLLTRFSEDKFSEAFNSTIGIDFKIKTIEIDGKKIKLQIWDTAGQERFRTITTAYYRGAMGIMLAYDITDLRSFQSIKNWVNNVKEHASEDVNMVLVGNKCDLMAKRKVAKEEAQALAAELNISEVIETSALSDVSVDAAFYTLAKKIKARLIDAGENKSANSQNTAQVGQTSSAKSLYSSCCLTK